MTKNKVDENSYKTWNSEKGMADAFAHMADAAEVNLGGYSQASYRNRNFSDLTSSLSGKPGLRRSDVDYFRPEDSLPESDNDIIRFSRNAYKKVGLIRNSIDLMGDFACQGIRLSHRNASVEQFYETWFKKVSGKEVSERFCHYLFREANLVLQMRTALIKKVKINEFRRSVASDISDVQLVPTFGNKEIPWRYNFLDPVLVEPIGGELASMMDNKEYAINIGGSRLSTIRSDVVNLVKHEDVLKKLPVEIQESIKTGGYVKLDPEKTYVEHYKKDDWDSWAKSIIYACGRDLVLYEKLKLSDQTALDGAINKIRVFKIGSLEFKLAPTPAATSMLKSILASSTGAGTTDIIWGPDMEILETKTDTSSFLGKEKYEPVLMSIYSCLGIPPTLTGTYGASGTTNNFMSLKTLTERLNYVRDKLIAFWNEQIEIVQKAMGFRYPAEIEFDFMNLDNPTAVARLLLDMSDRNIVSEEFVQRYIKAKPELEKRRLAKESKKEKVSPFHPVDKDFQFKKIYAQNGRLTPSELGLDVEDPSGEDLERKKIEMDEMRNKFRPDKENITKEQKPNGRPPGSTDKAPRKERQFQPVTRASIELWSDEAQVAIAKIMTVPILNTFGKKNMRSLTADQVTTAERIKFEILFSLEPFSEINKDTVEAALAAKVDKKYIKELYEWLVLSTSDAGRKLSIQEVRKLQSSFNSYYKTEKMA